MTPKKRFMAAAKRVINANIMASEFSATEMVAAAGAGLQVVSS